MERVHIKVEPSEGHIGNFHVLCSVYSVLVFKGHLGPYCYTEVVDKIILPRDHRTCPL